MPHELERDTYRGKILVAAAPIRLLRQQSGIPASDRRAWRAFLRAEAESLTLPEEGEPTYRSRGGWLRVYGEEPPGASGAVPVDLNKRIA